MNGSVNEIPHTEIEKEQIESWTDMKIENIIFDSDIDNWKVMASVFDQKIINKNNLIFSIEDEDGNLFGGYINETIYLTNNNYLADPNAFLFSLKSNGRFDGMLKFENKYSQYTFYMNESSDGGGLFSFGCGDDIYIYKENRKKESYCCQFAFDYNGITTPLCNNPYPKRFTPTRIIVIQLIV